MFFAQQQQQQQQLSSISIASSSVTTKRMRWERLDVARFFFSLSLSLSVSRASGRVVSRSSSKRSSALLSEGECSRSLSSSSLSSSSSSRWWWWWWWWKMREKRDPRDRDPRGIFKSAWFFCPKCDSATEGYRKYTLFKTLAFDRRRK